MTLEQIVSTGLPALGAVAAIAIFFWRRYQGLEKRFRKIELQLIELEHKHSLSREATAGIDDMHGYLINANKELVEHRTQRFSSELKHLEDRLCADISEIKRFLERTTEFTIRQ